MTGCEGRQRGVARERSDATSFEWWQRLGGATQGASATSAGRLWPPAVAQPFSAPQAAAGHVRSRTLVCGRCKTHARPTKKQNPFNGAGDKLELELGLGLGLGLGLQLQPKRSQLQIIAASIPLFILGAVTLIGFQKFGSDWSSSIFRTNQDSYSYF